MRAHSIDQPTQSRFALDIGALAPVERTLLLVAFAVAYTGLVALGYALKENLRSLTIIWPAAGLLLVVLYLVPLRQWLWIIPLQLAAEFAVGEFRSPSALLDWPTCFPLGNLADGMAGALLTKWLIAGAVLPNVRGVIQFIAAAAVGAAIGALLGAVGAVHVLEDTTYLHQWQLWWTGNWLGSLTIAPVVFTWTIRWHTPDHAVLPVRAGECVLLAAVLGAATAWIFYSAPASPASLLQLPSVLVAILVLVAFRLPPRWSVLLSAAAVLLAAEAASRGLGPFANDPNAFGRVAALQTFLAAVGMLTFILSTVLAEKRRVLDSLTLSEERYRSFVAQSTEAVWRIELDEAMPIGLTLAEQLAWLERHAYLAECNREFRDLMRRHGADGSESGRWRADAPWAALLVEHLEEAARRGYSMDGLKLALQTGAQREHWLASVSGVVEEGRLERIWGVARNVTELVVLNERLRREQERLQAYARQLTGAEERARRATAVDLHDGIGQMLVGLGMSLEVAAAQSAPSVRALLEEMRDTLRNIQETTRRVIADLSPPGLYELGLGAALQWLALYMRNKSNLVVNLELQLDERVLNLELRILVFKIVRELLRNIVKHARVDSAVVVVASDLRQLVVDVRDRGVGFEWQFDLFGSGTHGFGLWSIADRVRMAAGELTVETAPGRGCHVRLVFPLNQDPPLNTIEPRAS